MLHDDALNESEIHIGQADGDHEPTSRSLPRADRFEVAARIRALFDERPVSDLASRLRVDVDAISDAVDASMPVHSVDVLAAISFAFGVDPTWLLTGEYDSRTHQAAATSPEDAERVIRSILRRAL